MHAGRFRVEFIRFSLLVILTIGLVSVAVRYNDHGSSGTRASSRPSASASVPGESPSATTGAGGSQSPSPAQSPGASPSSAPATGGAGGPGGGGGTGAETGGGTGTGTDGGVATLPRTGPTRAAQLAALALLCIGWGGISMAVAGRRRPQAVTRR